MDVIRADAMGLCSGVHDALTVAMREPRPAEITIYGRLASNPSVDASLRQKGFVVADEIGGTAMPATSRVLVTAHGISDAERNRLRAAGKKLLDTTCPLVKKAHAAAMRLHREGRLVLVIGEQSHPEVTGLTGDIPKGMFEVLELAEDARQYAHRRLGILAQTTTPPLEVASIRKAVEAKNPHADIRFIDTICSPTKQRQVSLLRLLDQVDAVVAGGGPESASTRRLVELCECHGVRAYRVAGPHELQERWFRGCDAVGITAGMSTTDSEVDAVQETLRRIDVPLALACA